MQYRFLNAVVVALLATISCRDPVAPGKSFGAISISVWAEGIDAPDAIGISVDGGTARRTPLPGTASFYSLKTGPHTVTTSDVPTNCSFDDGDRATVNVSADGIANTAFPMRCVSASGSISVLVSVVGRATPVWVSVAVDNVVQPSILGNDKVVFEHYAGGQHTVSVASTPAGCEVTGSINPQQIQLLTGQPIRDTASVKFDVMCDSREPEFGLDRRIAFQRGDVVMLTGEDGRNPVQFIQGLAPSWSADGRFLAYGKQQCEPTWGCDDDIWIIGEDGYLPHAVTSAPGMRDYDPAISPDGSRIAFVRFVYGPDGTELVVADLSDGSVVRISDWYPLSHPTWSPDGKRIVFTCESGFPPVGYGLCIISAASSCPETDLYECPSLEHLGIGALRSSDPAWSPDGSLIAFTIGCARMFCGTSAEADSSQIALFNLKTRAITKLSSGHTPAWSPDGTRLVFAGNSDRPGLQIINIDGTGLIRITTNGHDTAPSWR
ncbi:MAG TPA: hypothetical protein VM099_09235 [Gemmatimonadaceae bacterium]|nr:hypothetical protein [Gemmatimonadaceae bacterium]